MKRLLYLLIAASVVFTVVDCKKNNPDQNTDPSSSDPVSQDPAPGESEDPAPKEVTIYDGYWWSRLSDGREAYLTFILDEYAYFTATVFDSEGTVAYVDADVSIDEGTITFRAAPDMSYANCIGALRAVNEVPVLWENAIEYPFTIHYSIDIESADKPMLKLEVTGDPLLFAEDFIHEDSMEVDDIFCGMAFSWKENFSVGFSAGKTFINCSPDEKVYGVYAPQLWKGDGDSGSATVRVEQAAVFEGLCTPRQSINEVSGVSYEMTFRSTGDDLFLSTANGEEKYIEDIDIIPTWLTGAWKGSATVESKNVDYYLCFTPERGSVYVWFVSTDGHLYKGEFLYTLEDGVSVDLDTYRCSSGIINSLYMVDEESYIETDCSEDVEKLLTYLTLFGNLGLANFDISLIKDELFVVNIRRENKSGWEDLVFVGVEEG